VPTYGASPAGYTAKPVQAILGDIENAQLATMDAAIDLSPTGPQGQSNGILANALGDLWQLLGVAFNSNSRQAAEGSQLDNIGNEVGPCPRAGSTFTQVFVDLTFSSSSPPGSPYAPGTLVANVAGNAGLTFSNFATVTVTATAVNGVLFQAQTIGSTPTINPGALSVITSPVSGWTGVNNPLSQSQLGAAVEPDAIYAARQQVQIAAQGTCNPPATVAAVYALAAAQSPPITAFVNLVENDTSFPDVVSSSLTLPPHSFALIVYDVTGFFGSNAHPQALMAPLIWGNKPVGIQSFANLSAGGVVVSFTDPVLGAQTVYYTVPGVAPLFVSAMIAIRPGFTWASVSAAIPLALLAASVAPTPPGGIPPNGQLLPGTPVIGSQLEAVIMSVPGVADVQALSFGFSAAPVNTAPLPVSPTSIATIVPANVVLTQGTFP
jgi:hypothetical protein